MKHHEHPCYRWCGQQLLGIVDNQNLLNGTSLRARVSSRRPLRMGPYDVVLTCTHGRRYFLLPDPKSLSADPS